MSVQEKKLETLERQLSSIGAIINDPEHEGLTEISVNPDGKIFIEQNGVERVLFGRKMSVTERELIIRAIVGYNGLYVNQDNPSVGAKMPVYGGGRFQAIIPPVVSEPCFSIRIPAPVKFTLDDLIEKNAISFAQGEFLREAVAEHRNILLAGGTGSGKTTIANALLGLITKDRILMAEDNAELLPVTENVVPMLTSKAFTLVDAVHTSMRMSPKRIIVGEVRDGSTALDLVKGWLTGHPGGISTIHSDSAEGAIRRLKALMLEVVQTPPEDDINEAINVVGYVAKVYDSRGGSVRKLVELWDRENDEWIQ